jgi:hypothetical protein
MCPIELLSQTIPSGALLVVYDIIVIGNTLKLIGLNCFVLVWFVLFRFISTEGL